VQWGALAFVGSFITLLIYRYYDEIRQKQEAQNQAVESLQRETKVREQFTQQLLQSQDREQKKISMELHDAVGQELLVIKNMASLSLKSSEKEQASASLVNYLHEISAAASTVIESVRNLSRTLYPYQLDNLGLTASLESILSRVSDSSDVRIDSSIENVDKLLPKESELHLFRILQESANNILKHSNAGSAAVTVKKEEGLIRMTIQDNGSGFPGGKNQVHGFGLSGMAERVAALHGTMKIQSEPNHGTCITITIPIEIRNVHDKNSSR
jgi:signal transduction histidine kinase